MLSILCIALEKNLSSFCAWLFPVYSSLCGHSSLCCMSRPYWIPCGFANWACACAVRLAWMSSPWGCLPSLSRLTQPGPPEAFNPSLHLAQPLHSRCHCVHVRVDGKSIFPGGCKLCKGQSHYSSLCPQHVTPWVVYYECPTRNWHCGIEKWLPASSFLRV